MISLSAAVNYWAQIDPGRTAVVYAGNAVSYGELLQRVRVCAGVLRSRGVGKDDVVALLMKNSAAFVELAIAVSQVGAVLLPINYRLARDEIDYIVGHAGARLLFVDEELRDSASGTAEIIELASHMQADSRALASAQPPDAPVRARLPGDLFRLMYTSGTTDRPKGVMHSYQNYYWKCLDHIAVLGLCRSDRLLVAGPLYHVGAFDLPGLAVLIVGGALAILREFDERAALQLIQSERLSCAWMAPVMLSRVMALAVRESFDVSSMQWVIGGGERTPEERIREFGRVFPRARYIDAYGLTETCGGDSFMQPGRELTKIGSTGRAVPHVEIAIFDEQANQLGSGQHGEIWIRGPKVTAGYWRDPDRTRASFHDDWLRTGDIGCLDEEGFLYLTDRKKDMIISGGENIASAEVERVLYQLPQVAEAAVIGLPDDRWGEQVVAVVSLRAPGTLDLPGIQAYCSGQLARFKIPKQLFIKDALPRTPSGKVLKRILRQELLDARERNDTR